MTQTVPATAVLGPGLTGMTIGLRVLNLDGTTYAAFSTTSVAETAVAGTYRKAGGVVVPDAGGYLVWGVSGTDYAEATVEPKPAYAGDEMDLVDAPNATAVEAIQSGLATPTNITAGTITTVTTVGALGVQAKADVNAEVDAAISDAGLAQPGDQMALVDDAIKASKFDETTAFPLAAADSGSTTVFRTGADGDTGESLSDQIDSVPAAVDTELSASHGSGAWAASGSGTVTWTYALTSSVDDTPIADADVWVTTDAGGSNVIASGQTDQNGEVVFELDPGTVYVWRQKSGWNFSNPDTKVVV